MLLLGLATTSTAKAPTVGDPAPDFQFTTFDGKKLKLADFRGQVLVINIWATWCGPCKKELPLLDTFYRIMKDKGVGLSVIGITTEDSVPAYQLKKLREVLMIPLAKGFKGPYDSLGGVPTNFIIDRAGILRYAQAGAFSLDDLNNLLVPMLNEHPEQAESPPHE
ncbi:MAG: TlpA disulfide reductase family protein [Steroidobacteraceae bacterium]